MTHTERTLFTSLLITFALLCASIIANVWQHYHFADLNKMVRTDTMTTTVYVERTDTAPTAISEKVTGHVNVSDILPSTPSPSSPTFVPCTGSQPDSLPPSLPVVQKTFTDDSTYTAYVSGIKYDDLPRLDSVRVRERIVYQTITMTKEARRKRWSVGVTGGYGYGFASKQVEPYVGVGVSYSIFSF